MTVLFIGSGLNKIMDPATVGKHILSSAMPKVLKQVATAAGVNVPFGTKEAALLAQVIGGCFLLFSAMMITGLGRGLGAFGLFCLVIPITAFMHVNLDDPKKTSMENQIHVLKNLAIMGGLLYIACASCCGKKAGSCPCGPNCDCAAAASKKKRQ